MDTSAWNGSDNFRAFLEGGDDTFLTGADGGATLIGVISGGDGSDRIYGNIGHEYVDGGSGDDLLIGGGGRDYLFGNDGNDRIEGGSGNDRLWGGNGNDSYVIAGKDVVRDIQGTDNYEVEAGAHLTLLDKGMETDTMVFDFVFSEETLFKRVGTDLIVTDDDGTWVRIERVYAGKSEIDRGVDMFVDADGNAAITSLLDLEKGDSISGAEFF